MIDASKKHSYIPYKNTKVIKYYDKYDFSESANSMEDIFSVTHSVVTRDQRKQLIAASIIATEFNDGEYIKAEGRSDIVDNEYVKLNFSNKDILIGVLTEYRTLLSDTDVLEKASVILEYLEDEFAFKILSDNMNSFETSIAQFLTDKMVIKSATMGIAAFIPTYYSNNTKQRVIDDRSTNNNYLGEIGTKVITEIEVLRATYCPNTAFGGDGYMVNAITTDNHRVSFFTAKEDIATTKKNIKISCKIKSLGTSYKDDSINETQVNYVKLS
tara:strand:+ start:144 stop:956 length:813 start_codon:yes stop_codon:yes gene_type:complete